MKKVKLIGGICLALVLVVALVSCGPALAGKPEGKLPPGLEKKLPPGIEKAIESEAEVLPESIQPVVILQGSDYQMGYQYGLQDAEHINNYKDYMWAKFLGEAGGGHFGAGGYTMEELQRILKGFQYWIIEYAPELICMFKGMADGSTDAGYPLTYIDCLLMSTEWDIGVDESPECNYPEDVDRLPPSGWKCEHCSTFGAWGAETTDGQFVGIHSTDTRFSNQSTKVLYPETGNAYIASGGETGKWGFTWLMNDKGLFIGLTAAPAERDIDNQYGMPVDLSLYRLIRWCDTATEAKDMLLATQLTNGNNYLLADADGTAAYVIETNGGHKGVRESGEFGENGSFLVNTNHFLTDEMQVSQKPGKVGNCSRYNMLFDALTDYAGSVDFEFAKVMLRTPPVCHRGNRCHHVTVYEEGEAPKGYICTGCSNWAGTCGSRSFPIEPTYSFYQLSLEETPLAMAIEAGKTARSYIGQAHQELYELTYANVEYAPLSELLAEAKAEYYRGMMAVDDGQIIGATSTGFKAENETLKEYHEALTAFARAQAIALQVYNALVPFPTSP